VSVRDLVEEHGSPLWLADLDRVRGSLDAFTAAWREHWPQVEVAYSYKTNRLPAVLRAVAEAGAGADVAGEAEYALARDVVGLPGAAIVVNGPAKSAALLARVAGDGALAIADSLAEIERAAAAGVRRIGVRVAVEGVGDGPTRFGVPPADVPAAVARAAALGLPVEALGAHLVSTGFDGPLHAGRRLGSAIVVEWPPAPGRHAEAAAVLGALARDLGVATIDLGGGWPTAPAVAAEARAVCAALRDAGFAGRLVLEPGRAVVADAVDLACTVAAVKTLADGTRCVIVDAGTNLAPGALWAWPRIDAPEVGGPSAGPALVTGPLCLNVDVMHPAAELPEVAPGDLLVVRALGAYQQAHSTQFGELRPAVVALDGGRHRLCRRRETLDDLLAGDVALVAAGDRTQEENQ
jgi:diaminopimelate decarboxylase